MYGIARQAYTVFGSGLRHAAYAIFQKHSRQHNNGRNIGLMRAGTRMAGEAIVILHMVQLQPAIVNTLNLSEFLQLKVSRYDCLLFYIQGK
jgi:hypothetical protein